MSYQNTEQSSNNNPINIIVETASQAFTQEVFLFLFVALAIFVREKILHYLKIKKLKMQYFNHNSQSDLIHILLVKIMQKLDADRILLLQFHNGDSFFSNFDQLKVSMTHQITQPQIKNIDNIISLPISIIHRELEACRKNNNKFEWIMREDTFVKCGEYLESIGVELYGSKLLLNKMKVPVGIIGLHYCSKDYIYILADEFKLKLLNDLIIELEQLL